MEEGAGIRSTTKAGGAALIAAAIGSVAAMAHHPSGAHAGALGGIVHGAMMIVLTALAFGFVAFALSRGIGRAAMLAGLLAFAVSLFAHFGAATINGFVVPALAARGPGAVGHDVFLLCWEANQALAGLGAFATGAAYSLWSLDLLAGRGRADRLLGAAGIAAGLLPAVLLAAGGIAMDVAGAFLVYAAHAAWALLVGVRMLSAARGGSSA